MTPIRELHPLVHQLNLLNAIIRLRFGGFRCTFTVVSGGDAEIYGLKIYPIERSEIRQYVAEVASTLGLQIRYPHRSDGLELYLGEDRTTLDEVAEAMQRLSN